MPGEKLLWLVRIFIWCHCRSAAELLWKERGPQVHPAAVSSAIPSLFPHKKQSGEIGDTWRRGSAASQPWWTTSGQLGSPTRYGTSRSGAFSWCPSGRTTTWRVGTAGWMVGPMDGLPSTLSFRCCTRSPNTCLYKRDWCPTKNWHVTCDGSIKMSRADCSSCGTSTYKRSGPPQACWRHVHVCTAHAPEHPPPPPGWYPHPLSSVREDGCMSYTLELFVSTSTCFCVILPL